MRSIQSNCAGETSRPGDLGERFRSLRPAIRAPGVSAGALLPGGERWTAADGVANLTSGAPMVRDTPLRVGSITKTVTAAAVLLLAERGALTLGDPAVEHLPELRALRTDGHRLDGVTVGRLLLHRSGLLSEPPTRRWFEAPFPEIGELLERSDLIRIAIAPGSAYKYSNLGFALLGEIVARAAGCPYERFVREALLGPAGMSATTFAPPPGAARGYGCGEDGRWIEQAAQELGAERSAAGLWSTVDDLLRWAEVALGRVPAALPPATAALLARPQTAEDAALSRAHGYGWRLTRVGELVLRGGGGGVNGFTCHLAMDPAAGTAAVVLTNGHADPEALCLGLLGVERRGAAEPEWPAASSPSDPVGAYDGALDLTACIERRDDGALWLAGGLLDDRAGARLDPLGEDRYLVVDGRFAGEELELERSPRGEVVAFAVAGWRHPRRA